MEPSPASRPIVTACLLVIGNEILSGRTQDANLAYVANGLNEVGIQLREARVVPDDPDRIADTVNEVRQKFDYVFTTGGIGPTHDDITAECIARAFGVPLVLDPEAQRRVAAHCEARGVELNEARLRMARVPQGARLIDNPISAAPGFQIGNVFVMAGVPAIARAMFDGIKGRLAGGAVVTSRTIVCRLPEGQIAAGLSAIQDRYPQIAIGSYPAWVADGPRLSLVLRGTEPGLLERAAAEVAAMVSANGGTPQDASAL